LSMREGGGEEEDMCEEEDTCVRVSLGMKIDLKLIWRKCNSPKKKKIYYIIYNISPIWSRVIVFPSIVVYSMIL
jgi:hypothetical protein